MVHRGRRRVFTGLPVRALYVALSVMFEGAGSRVVRSARGAPEPGRGAPPV